MDYVTYIRSLVGTNKIMMNAAACIIVNDKKEILLQLRGDDHFWGLPGGIMEMGERPKESAKREVFEETGYEVELIQYLGDYHNFDKHWPGGDSAHIICFIYIGTIIGGTMNIDMDETLDLQWYSYENLPEIDAIDHLDAINDYFKQ
jgi:8-oxo-dGTP pyrophosphatase MutT (NUDIX family)